MDKNKLEETNKANNKSATNKDLSSAFNADVTSMYNMPNMTSGPSDATLEEKRQLNERSAEYKGTTKK